MSRKKRGHPSSPNLDKITVGNITYTHKSSSYLAYEDGKYTPCGGSDHGSYIYELTKLEQGKTKEGKEKWKAHITSYYFYELDGSPTEPQSMQSKNAQESLDQPGTFCVCGGGSCRSGVESGNKEVERLIGG